jgi:hypothetical protein
VRSRYLPGISAHVPWRPCGLRNGPRLAASRVSGRHRIPVIRAPLRAYAGLIPRGLCRRRDVRRRHRGRHPALGQAAGPGSSRSHSLITPSRSVPSRNALGATAGSLTTWGRLTVPQTPPLQAAPAPTATVVVAAKAILLASLQAGAAPARRYAGRLPPGSGGALQVSRQVRRRHRITVIRPTGAPQNRSTTDRRECAGCGPLLPPHCIATRTGESAPGHTGGAARTPCSPGCWTSRHYTACSQRSRGSAWACSRSASSPGLRITRIR